MVVDKGNVYRNKITNDIVLVVGYNLESISLKINGITQNKKGFIIENYIGNNYLKEELNNIYKEELFYYYIEDKTNLISLCETVLSEIDFDNYVYEKKISEKEVDTFVLKQRLLSNTNGLNQFINRKELVQGISEGISNFYKENESYLYYLLDQERIKFNNILDTKRKVLDRNKLEKNNKLKVKTLKDLLKGNFFITINKRYMYLYGKNVNNFFYIAKALVSNKDECFKLYLMTQSMYDLEYIKNGKEVLIKEIKGNEIIELESKTFLFY